MELTDSPVIFYDGDCGLCNGFVGFTLARDSHGLFRFASLQGETFAARIRKAVPAGADPDRSGAGFPGGAGTAMASMVLWDGAAMHYKSEAVLRAIERLGGPWTLARPLRALPRPWRDSVYDLVARNRYRWFGKGGACPLPAPAARNRFLP